MVNIKSAGLERGRGLFYRWSERMRRLFSKADLRHLSLAVAVILLLASAPSTAGVVVFGSSRPELTINICQPVQSLICVANILLARPAAVSPEFVLGDLGSIAARETPQLIDFKVVPDTPPPRHFV
jgi:hypothetical protein